MALITTNASPIVQYTPFTGLSALERSQSGIARAELVYWGNDDWAAPGAGNIRLFQIPQTTLPEDFGYVLQDVSVAIVSDGVTLISAEAVGTMRLYPSGVLGPAIHLNVVNAPGRQDGGGGTATGSTPNNDNNSVYPSIYGNKSIMNFTLQRDYKGVIYPFGGEKYSTTPKSTFDLGLSEQVAAGVGYKVHYYVRFLQYDIDQSYNYVIQSPQLTR